MPTINRNQLFITSCISLLVTSLSFGIRAGLLNTWAHEFSLSQEQIGIITSTAFWGFPLAVIIGGIVVDIIGMKKLLLTAFVLHLVGIILTITANGFWPLFISTLLIGMGNGTVEPAIRWWQVYIPPTKQRGLIIFISGFLGVLLLVP